MEFDDEDAEMLGFGSFWNETKEALRQGAKSTVVHARFHADARKPNTIKAAETRRRNKERRRELAAHSVPKSEDISVEPLSKRERWARNALERYQKLSREQRARRSAKASARRRAKRDQARHGPPTTEPTD